jgi:hypothetical protein
MRTSRSEPAAEFDPVIEAATDLVAVGIADRFRRRAIRAQSIGDDLPRSPVSLFGGDS